MASVKSTITKVSSRNAVAPWPSCADVTNPVTCWLASSPAAVNTIAPLTGVC
jgi:hypothetical protein